MATTGIVLTRTGTSVANVSSPVGTLPTTNGGTGLTSIGTANQVLAVNSTGTALVYDSIVAGTNVTISYAPGQIIINSTGGGTSLQLYEENPVSPSPPSASGANAIALLQASSAEAPDSLAIGPQSVARIQGSIAQSNGRFANSGDAQTGRYLMRLTTINSVPSQMYIDGSSVPLVMPDNSTWTFRITITAHRTDADDGHAGYEFKGVIYRQTGAVTTTIQGSISKTVLAESNTPWDANVVADTGDGGIGIMVTGQSSKTIRWLALIETVEVSN